MSDSESLQQKFFPLILLMGVAGLISLGYILYNQFGITEQLSNVGDLLNQQQNQEPITIIPTRNE